MQSGGKKSKQRREASCFLLKSLGASNEGGVKGSSFIPMRGNVFVAFSIFSINACSEKNIVNLDKT